MKRPSWLRIPKIPRPDVDLRDAHVYGGLVVAAWGGWQLSPSWTAVAIGAALVLFGVFVPRKPRKAA